MRHAPRHSRQPARRSSRVLTALLLLAGLVGALTVSARAFQPSGAQGDDVPDPQGGLARRLGAALGVVLQGGPAAGRARPGAAHRPPPGHRPHLRAVRVPARLAPGVGRRARADPAADDRQRGQHGRGRPGPPRRLPAPAGRRRASTGQARLHPLRPPHGRPGQQLLGRLARVLQGRLGPRPGGLRRPAGVVRLGPDGVRLRQRLRRPLLPRRRPGRLGRRRRLQRPRLPARDRAGGSCRRSSATSTCGAARTASR